jgi:hypothetical protein
MFVRKHKALPSGRVILGFPPGAVRSPWLEQETILKLNKKCDLLNHKILARKLCLCDLPKSSRKNNIKDSAAKAFSFM